MTTTATTKIFLGCDSIEINLVQYKKGAGLLEKCEIMAINWNEKDIQRLVTATQMQRVHKIKHLLGLIIDENGNLPHAANITPVQDTVVKVANSLNKVTSTTLGGAIYFTCKQVY